MKYIVKHEMTRTLLKITPHVSALNSASRKFQSSLFDLFAVPRRMFPWEHGEGMHIAMRPTPDIWWITKLAALSEDEKKIEFFISIPSDYVAAFRTKFANHEQWRKSSIEEVESPDFPELPIDNTDLYKMRYARHDIFSMDYDYSQQTTPIREVLGVTNELAAGEEAMILIRAEPLGRAKWKKIAEYAWEHWDKGGLPTRVGIDPRRLFREVFSVFAHVVTEVKSALQDVLTAVDNTFFKGNAGAPVRDKVEIRDPERDAILINGDLSTRTKKKRNLPVFNTQIRYMVHSTDSVRRAMLARSIDNAYSELSGDNYLKSVKINVRAREEMDNLFKWNMSNMDPLRMSIDEMGKMIQLPTGDLQGEFSDALASNSRVEIELPDTFLDKTGLLVGTATDRGETFDVHIPTKDNDILFTPRAVVGSPRVGKDQHVINMVVEGKLKHNIGAVIPDVVNEKNGHRGMADAIRDHLPPEDVIDIDLGDTQNPIYLGMQSIVRNIPDLRIAADRIAEEMTEFLLADGDEDKFQTAHYLREAAKITNGDPMGIKLMFTSPTYRKERMKEVGDMFDTGIWQQFNSLKDGQQNQLFAPIMKRIGQMESEFLRPIFFQTPNPDLDLYRWIDEGKVVIFRIPTGAISERAVQILVYWIVLNVFLIKLSQGGRSKAAGTYLVLNEPHQFLSDGLVHFMERMLSEGPKYRLAPVIVFHHFTQFKKHSGFVDMMMAASMNWHLFANTHYKVYDNLMPYLCNTFANAQQAFEATRRFQYIAVWLNSMGEYEPPFVVDSLPLVGDRYASRDNGKLTETCSRLYGRPIAEVLQEIRERNRMAYN